MKKIFLSHLSHTWIFDIDGTIFKHNQYLHGKDQVLPGVVDFWKSIPTSDLVILITARPKSAAVQTTKALMDNQIWFSSILYDAPVGERILVNDIKPGGLLTAISINLQRDSGLSDFSVLAS
jgi:hypothetical protein